MEAFLVEFFHDFNRLVVATYGFSMALIIGSLFTISFLVKPVLYQIKIPRERYGKSMELLRRYIVLVGICMFLVVASGITCAVGSEFAKGNPATLVIVNTIELIWVCLSINFIYVYAKYKEAKKHFEANDHVQAHENLALIFTYALPLNFVMSILCAYFNILIRV